MAIDNRAIDDAARRVGDRWTLRIVAALLEGDRTFGELAADIGTIASNVLSARLRTLERDALITARPYQRNPVRMRYSLTVPGRRLAGAVALLADWGAQRSGAVVARHESCGTPLDVRPWCPTCEAAVDPAGDSELTWV